MPRYFFDIAIDDHVRVRDHRGMELPDLEIARIEAVEIWSHFQTMRPDRASAHAVEVTDDCGLTLAVARHRVDPIRALRPLRQTPTEGSAMTAHARRLLRRMTRSDRGTSAVEFAMIAPIVLMLVFGIIVYGLLFGATHTIQHMAAEAARASIAGMTDAERNALARASIANALAGQSLIRPSDLTVWTGNDPADPEVYVVELNLDTRGLGIFTFGNFVPMPSSLVTRTVRIRRGGL